MYWRSMVSSMVERMIRVSWAMPEVPSTITGITMCFAMSRKRPTAVISPWSMDVMPPMGSQVPPTPEVAVTTNNNRKARKKLGMARPTKAKTEIS